MVYSALNENIVTIDQDAGIYPDKLEQYQHRDEEKKEIFVNHIPSIWLSKRFYTTAVIFLCYMNLGMIISNINIAVVEMTSPKNISVGNITITKPAEFQWDPSTVGIVSSIISYGGLFSIGGGYFVNKLGGSVSGAVVLMICGVLTLLQPSTLYMDYRIFLSFRLLTGFFANCFFISSAEIFSRWFPRRERSTLISFCSNGGNVGMTVMYPLFGLIADRLGWQMVFYTSGFISLAIGWLCLTVVTNLPSQDKWISQEELTYILNETYDDSRKRYQTSHPYKKILLSPAVWAICLGDSTMLWVQTIVSGCLPLYAKDSTGRSTDEIGMLSSVPVAVTIILYPLSGTIIDYWKNHHTHVKPTRMDKTIIGSAFLSMSLFFLGCAIFSNFTISMVFFVTIQITKSIVQPVLEPNVVNIAPNDSSIVAGLTKLCSCSSTIISRTLTGFMTINHTTQEWNNCFLLAAGVLIIGAVTFVKYGSSEPQTWSLSSNTKEKEQLVEDESRYLLGPNHQK
ncbi:vesicular glutamate transporter 3-like [Planococcus citri]|uniref:vesicular glutamate transporter 3-like n=1 Tax=Planococcus citri TaxID=170843 RepID=UPI0031F885AF